ncbi:unnamed protein product [Rhodiola kirilowii]
MLIGRRLRLLRRRRCPSESGLTGDLLDGFNSRPNVTGKRQRQDDDKWEHDLFKDIVTRLSNDKIGTGDLRSKLQRKSLQSNIKNGNRSNAGVVRDLREKLSGTMHSQPLNNNIPKAKAVGPRNTIKKIVGTAPGPEKQKVAGPPSKKSKADTAVDSFLKSLGLEKYLITFKAEEIDMTALVHMSEDDLKVLGIPMGPRKKILLALDYRGSEL